MLRKRLQLALIHVAVAMTLVPINSTLNRVMIKEMALSATLVALLASLPYIFSPLQMAIGSHSDRHPWLGYRRTGYIALGLLLCVAGVALAPQAVFLMPHNRWLGLALSLLVFAAWGMGYNVASVAYFSLASELSDEKGRSRTISVMWFVMITGIILTAATLGRMLENYTPAKLEAAFLVVALASLALGLLGLIGLEPRFRRQSKETLPARKSWRELAFAVAGNPQARRFFLYLIVLLAAILGQDVLLEPYAGQAFGLPVSATTRITSIWGGCFLVALLAAGFLERRLGKRGLARLGAWAALAGFAAIAASGPLVQKNVFYSGVLVLGLGTGFSTVANLSLMLDMTTRMVGMYMGAWGMAEAMARGLGGLLSGGVRDVFSALTQNAVLGYVVVFALQGAMMATTLVMLRRINVTEFQHTADPLGVTERAALVNETGG
jgi:BCD family chlorophyll transporter-like MFS transporter